MSKVGFEPTIPAFEKAKIVNVLDGAATVIGVHLLYLKNNIGAFAMNHICMSIRLSSYDKRKR
jgi:hypothetical protein